MNPNDKNYRENYLSLPFEKRLEKKLYEAYLEARKNGKRKTYDEHKFEINQNVNLELLKRDLMRRTYTPGRSTAHIIKKPVIREIFAATFRDRIIHHLIFATTYPWWDKRFVDDSYSCRIDKGTLYGIKRLDYHIRAVSHNYARHAWVYKFDIQGYFMSLPRKKLYKMAIESLTKQFEGQTDTEEYKLIKFLWRQIIMDDPVNGAARKGKLSDWDKLPRSKSLFCQPKGKGIVIGNLTSQLLSNMYLDGFDKYIMYELGYRHYGRYVDDFYIIVSDEDLPQLKRDVVAIEAYLKRKELTLHPKKRSLQDSKNGVAFLGAVVYHDHIVIGKRCINNLQKALIDYKKGDKDASSIVSYLGIYGHYKSKKMMKKVFDYLDLDFEYWAAKISTWSDKNPKLAKRSKKNKKSKKYLC